MRPSRPFGLMARALGVRASRALGKVKDGGCAMGARYRQEESGRVAPPSALAGRPLLSASHPAEMIGEDSAARLVVKAKHFVWRSAPLLSAPRQP